MRRFALAGTATPAIVLVPCLAFGSSTGTAAQAADRPPLLRKVSWLGHASIRIEGSKIIYIDPCGLAAGRRAADIVLITHDHDDHFCAADVGRIKGERTVVVGPSSVVARVSGETIVAEPGKSPVVGRVRIRAVPACNVRASFHPCDKNHVGYVLSMDGATYYHAGDTDRIPEMKSIRADIAFLPVGGTYTMDAAEAASAAGDIKPKLAVPIHWGAIVGAKSDATRFKVLCKGRVEILDKVD